MKYLYALVLLLLSTSTSLAGDKIGNGGGAWVCSVDYQVQEAHLVDFYEAQNEFGLSLISSSTQDPIALSRQMGGDFVSKFPAFSSTWSHILDDVITRIHFVNAELEVVSDSLYRIRPLGSLCRTGWNYVQFANYTNYNEVLVRQDLWLSTALPAIDKAGLLWHEVIYRWVRENFGDQDSVRARRIVGILFSDINPTQAQTMISNILNKQADSPAPQPQPQWVCMIRNNFSFKFFYAFGANELTAKNQSLKACQDGGDAYHCGKQSQICEQMNSSHQFTCQVTNNLTQREFIATGRSHLEAEAKSRKACSDAGDEVHCSQDIECE